MNGVWCSQVRVKCQIKVLFGDAVLARVCEELNSLWAFNAIDCFV